MAIHASNYCGYIHETDTSDRNQETNRDHNHEQKWITIEKQTRNGNQKRNAIDRMKQKRSSQSWNKHLMTTRKQKLLVIMKQTLDHIQETKMIDHNHETNASGQRDHKTNTNDHQKKIS